MISFVQLYGFAYGGPFGHFFHKLMDTIFKGKKGNSTVAKKVLPFEPNYHLLGYSSQHLFFQFVEYPCFELDSTCLTYNLIVFLLQFGI